MVIVPGVMFRVWDYVGDNFVHRLLQTDSNNGKLVEGADNSFQGNMGCTVCGHGVANGASGMATSKIPCYQQSLKKLMRTTAVPIFRLGFRVLLGFRAPKAGDGAWSVKQPPKIIN